MLLVYPQRNGTSAPPAAQLSESALNLNTPARQNASKLAFVFGLFVLWLRRRNGAFRLSGPFAGPSAIRVWNRSFFFHCRVFQILRLGKNASELAFFSRLIRIFAGTETVPMFYVAKYSQDQDRRTARDLLRRNSPPRI